MNSLYMDIHSFIKGLKPIVAVMQYEYVHYYDDYIDHLREHNNNIHSLIIGNTIEKHEFMPDLTTEEQVMYIQFLLLSIGEEI